MEGIAAVIHEAVEIESELSRISDERYVDLCALISHVSSETICVDAHIAVLSKFLSFQNFACSSNHGISFFPEVHSVDHDAVLFENFEWFAYR